MSPAAFQAAGTAVSGTTGSLTAGWPTHVPNDIALLMVECTGGQAASLSTANGFVEITNSPANTGATTAGTRIHIFWCRATSSSMASPVITTGANHGFAVILTFRGVKHTGTPYDVTANAVKASASTSASAPSVTTTSAQDLIVNAIARDDDSAAAEFSAWANANLTSVAEVFDLGTISGNGGGIGVATGVKAAAGATGATTATVTSSINASITLALLPDNVAPNAPTLITPVDTVTTYYIDGSDAAATDPNAVWTNDANAFDGNLTDSAHCATAGSTSSNYLMAEGTNAPTTGLNITQVRAKIYNTVSGSVSNPTANASIYTNGLAELLGTPTYNGSSGLNGGAYTTLSVPTGGWTWQKVNDLEVKIFQTGGSGSPNIDVDKIEIEVTTNIPTVSTTTPTVEWSDTDTEGDDIRYNVQIDTANTFDTQAGTPSVQDTYIATPNSSYDVSSLAGSGGTNESVAQSFTANANYSGARIDLLMNKFGTPTDNIFIDLATTVGGAAIATSSNIAASGLSTDTTNGALATFTFSTPYTLTLGTKYYIRLWRAATDGTNRPQWMRDNINGYANGGAQQLSAGSWSGEHAFNDAMFKVFNSNNVPLLSKVSGTDSGFTDVTNGADTDPFASGNTIDFTVQGGDALTSGVTYYWRVRGIDPSGSNEYGSYSSTRSFTVSSGTLHTSSLSGSFSASGLITKKATNRTLTASFSDSGAFASRAITAVLSASSFIASGILNKLSKRSLTGSFTASGVLTSIHQHFASLTATFSASGVITSRAITRSLTAAYSTSGSLAKAITRSLTASFTASGNLAKRLGRGLTGTFSDAGNITNRVLGRSLSGTYSDSGNITSRNISRNLTGTYSDSGAFSSHNITRSLTATFTASGNLARRVARSLSGSFSAAGSLTRQVGKSLSASFRTSGVITTRAITRSFTATYTTAGNLTRSITRSLSATFTTIGNLATAFSHGGTAFSQSFNASFSAAGNLSKKTSRNLAASFSSNGVITKAITRSLTATFTTSGNLIRAITRSLAGIYSDAGALTRRTLSRTLTASFSASGTLNRLTKRSLTATFTASAGLAKTIQRSLSASFSGAGNLASSLIHSSTSFTKSLAATFSTSGNLSKTTNRSLAGNFTMSGNLTRRITRSLTSLFSSNGALSKIGQKTFMATYRTTGSLLSLVRQQIGHGIAAIISQFSRSNYIDERKEADSIQIGQDGKTISGGRDTIDISNDDENEVYL